ncbi:MAG: TAT-variant-translocated molybdopterin oxidoreductase, partial [Myxococcales bacterium]
MSDTRLPIVYWQSLAARDGEARTVDGAQREFAEELPLGPAKLVAGVRPDGSGASRRDFLKLMGLSSAALTAACGRAPVQKAIPYLVKPEEIVPGVATWYASTCAACPAACGLLLKTRDGRPIKVEGNDAHPVSRGGACAAGQATVLSLYDGSRARAPMKDGTAATWALLDEEIPRKLRAVRPDGIRVVVPAVLGPSAQAALRRFLAAHPGARAVRHVATPDWERV